MNDNPFPHFTNKLVLEILYLTFTHCDCAHCKTCKNNTFCFWYEMRSKMSLFHQKWHSKLEHFGLKQGGVF